MPKPKFKRKSGKSSAMNQRVKKLEEQIVPIVKTFEQRQHDFTSIPAATYLGTPLPYLSPQVFRASDLYPTLQDGSTTSFENGTVRLGDRITMKSIHMKGEVRATASTAATAELDDIVRLIAVRFPDNVNNLTNAEIISAVLQQYGTATPSAYNSVTALCSSYKNVIDAQNNLPLQKYEILHDQTMRLSNVARLKGGARYRQAFNIKLKWRKGLVMQYGKFGNDVPDLNHVVFICLSDSTIAPHPDITLVSRAKYMDA